MKRLAIITTHPIQYYAPLFKLLSERNNIAIKVFYTWGQSQHTIHDPGFGIERKWDIPLLNGYEYEFVKNTSSSPGSNHYNGIINPGLINKIKNYKPNAILVFGWAFKSHLSVMRYLKGKIPVFFRGDSTLLDEKKGYSIRKMLRRIFLRWVYSYTDYAFYAGKNNKEYFKVHGLKEQNLIYAPHAVDNDRFNDVTNQYDHEAKDWLARLGVADSKSVILFSGKLEEKKNPSILIEAAKALPQMHFIIVGNGPLEQTLKNASKGLLNITFIPFQNQSKMPVVYRLCDIFVLPSKGPGETWGLAINEAMASGCIVIASNKCGGSIDLVKNGINGFIIKPDAQSLISVIRSLGNDKAIYDTYKTQSIDIVNNFTLEKAAAAIELNINLVN